MGENPTRHGLGSIHASVGRPFRPGAAKSPRREDPGGGFRCATPQNGGTSDCWGLPAPAGADPQGPPPDGWPPNPLPPRLTLFTFAVAYRRDGPISSAASSTTVRFSPSLVS